MRKLKNNALYAAIGDTCGFYDVFTVRQAIEWNPEYGAQQVRDGLRCMIKQGVITRVAYGTYAWKKRD